MPTEVATPWPSGPEVVSTPLVQRYSGWPGHFEPSCRNRFRSSSGTAGSPRISYSGSTARTPVRCNNDQSSAEACPADSTKRSRFGQIGSAGSKRRKRCQSVYVTGAMPIGVPGCPEFAASIASMQSVRIVVDAEVVEVAGGDGRRRHVALTAATDSSSLRGHG